MGAALQALAKFRRIAESHQVDEILAAATSATREAENGPEFLAAHRRGDRHPAARHLRDRGSPADPPGGRLRRGRHARPGGGHRHRRRQRRDHRSASERPAAGAAASRLGVIRHDGALRQVGSARRSATSASWCGSSTARSIELRQARSSAAGFERVDRDVGHDPEPRHDGRARGVRPRAGRDAEPAHPGQARSTGCGSRSCRSGCSSGCKHSGPGAPAQRHRRGRQRAAGHDPAAARAPRTSRSATLRCARGWCSTTSTATGSRSRRPIAIPTSGGAASIELAERCNYCAPSTRSRSRGSRCRCSTRRAACMGSAIASASGWNTRRCMHDLGVHISYEKHHRHSYYLVKHGDLRGFDPQEIEVMALVARYHRRASPKKAHDGLRRAAAGLRRTVRDALPRSCGWRKGSTAATSQPLARSIDLHDRGDDYLMQLRTTGDAELELWAAHRHVSRSSGCSASPCASRVRGTTPHVEHSH